MGSDVVVDVDRIWKASVVLTELEASFLSTNESRCSSHGT